MQVSVLEIESVGRDVWNTGYTALFTEIHNKTRTACIRFESEYSCFLQGHFSPHKLVIILT